MTVEQVRSDRLAGLALVTGAAGSIGHAVAMRLAAEGATIVLTDLPPAADALAKTADACRNIGGHVHTGTLDVT